MAVEPTALMHEDSLQTAQSMMFFMHVRQHDCA